MLEVNSDEGETKMLFISSVTKFIIQDKNICFIFFSDNMDINFSRGKYFYMKIMFLLN